MFRAAVLTVSDRSFRGERPDAGGPLVAELLEANDTWNNRITEDEVRAAFSLIATEWTEGDN